MNPSNFSEISKNYEKTALIQKGAAEILFDLLKIESNEDVLDLGCGPGHLTQNIREITAGDVVGADPSKGMIEEANKKYKNIRFLLSCAEGLDFKEEFDVIFCNSAFQWFKYPEIALKRCFNALKPGGRMGIQSPGGKIYSPTFREAVQTIKRDPCLNKTFSHFNPPWLFCRTAEDYSAIFVNAGFRVSFSEIRTITTPYPPAKVFDIFKSGAAAGYLNQEYYDIPISDSYRKVFLETVKHSFKAQAENCIVNLVFNRIFLIAEKPENI